MDISFADINAIVKGDWWLMKTSIIISTYNQPEYLKLVLNSIAQQQNIDYSSFEVLIADDGSKSDTTLLIETIKQNFPCELKHIWHPDNGFQKASILNKAVAQAQGEYLIFIDGDCVVPADFVYRQLLLRENGYFVAGNRVLLSKGFTEELLDSESINFTKWSMLQWILARIKGRTNKLIHWLRMSPQGKWRKSRSTNWKFPKGCNVALSKADYIKVNGYDEAFSGWGHEDADFFVRLLHAGLKIKDGRFAIPVYHLWHKLNDRTNEDENMQRLLSRVKDNSVIRADKGVDQYIGK